VRGIRSLGIALLLCVLVPTVRAADVVHIYKVQHRTAEELLPLVQTAMAGGGTVGADPGSNTLVLAGSSEEVAAALALLSRVDRPPRSVVLRYASRRLGELEAQGIHVDWGGRADALRVGSLAFPAGANGVGVQATGSAGTGESDRGGEIRLLEGQRASILTGEAIPVTTRRGPAAGRRPTLQESTAYVAAESGFDARARILGDGRIELELRSVDSTFRAGPRLAHSTSLNTLVVEPGKTVVLGGLFQDADERSTSLFAGSGSSQRSDERLLVLTATVE
jgi:type II secretory pathway component GspD/PulD (secretin)